MSVRVGSFNVEQDISIMSRDMQLMTSVDRDNAIRYADQHIDVMHYMYQMKGCITRKITEHDSSIMRVSDMGVGKETIDDMKRISNIFVVSSRDILAPAHAASASPPRSRPDMYAADITVHGVRAVDVDGVIFTTLYGAEGKTLAMIEAASEPVIHFYLDDVDKTLTVKGDHNVVVFVKFKRERLVRGFMRSRSLGDPPI